jgi:hypothetical protein
LDFTGEPQLKAMVFADSLKATYFDDDVPTIGNNSASSALSPFAGKSALECYQILKQISEEIESSINPEPFAILDGRSMQDDSALLCEAGEEGVSSVRVAFGITQCRLMQYFAADAGVDRDRETTSRSSDGVLREAS